MTNLFALALIATVSNAVNTAMYVECYTQQHTVDHALDGVFPTYVPRTIKVRVCATTGLSLEEKVLFKALRLGARRGATKAPSARVRLNDEAKRASITLMCMNAQAANAAKHAADAHAIARNGNTLSDATKAARQAQSSAQLALNAVRALARMVETKPSKVSPTKAYIVRTANTPILGKLVGTHALAADYKSTHVVHATCGAKVADVRGEIKTTSTLIAIRKANDVAAKAAAWALRQERIAMRRERIARMCSSAWYNKGIWIDPALAEACNDACYEIRTSAMTELLLLVGGAA